MRNELWVWPEVGDAGTSGAGAVPLRLAKMMGQQKKNKKKKNLLAGCFARYKIRGFELFACWKAEHP